MFGSNNTAATVPVAVASSARYGQQLHQPESGVFAVSGRSPFGMLLSVTLVASELSLCQGEKDVLERASAIAREWLELEHLAFYLREPLEGGFHLRRHRPATTSQTDAGDIVLDLDPGAVHAIHAAWINGRTVVDIDRAVLFEKQTVLNLGEGGALIRTTPLIAARHLVGLMCHEGSAQNMQDPETCMAIGLLCSLVAVECFRRHERVLWRPMYPQMEMQRRSVHSKQSALAERARQAIDEDSGRSGYELAAELGVSAGYLSRAFKGAIGLSLVKYKNVARIQRFLRLRHTDDHGRTIKRAALEAGFGSYAQFHRIYTGLIGSRPSAVRGSPRP